MSDIERALAADRELRPEYYAKLDAVARVIDPAVFTEWLPMGEFAEQANGMHALRQKYMRSQALVRAEEIFKVLCLHERADWVAIFKRIGGKA